MSEDELNQLLDDHDRMQRIVGRAFIEEHGPLDELDEHDLGQALEDFYLKGMARAIQRLTE